MEERLTSYRVPKQHGPRITVIGGGHGLSNMLRGLKQYTENISAIVTVADDGGGSGMLRQDLGMPPPGDIRNCLEALANTEPLMRELMQYRFKDGSLAGPKVLEHIVDVVLQFEGDTRHAYRILRSIKNRFGSTAELAIFEMNSNGLRQVSNPSEMLIPSHAEDLSGVAISAMMDGSRPFLIEMQALVSSAAYGTPQRSATGFDTRRMNMLLAVLEKRAGFKLSAKDVFLNVAGGLRVSDPACDLAVVCAILSSNFDLPISDKTAFAAEVGLSGEIRPVSHIEQRIAEAERLGFERIFISSFNQIADTGRFQTIKIVEVADVPALCRLLFK